MNPSTLMKQLMRGAGVALLAISITPLCATAGTLAQKDWQPTACGTKPSIAALDLSTVDAYNKSVGIINAYRPAIRNYVNCVVNEANSDLQTITAAATAVRQDATTVEDDISAQLKAAEAKLPK